MANEMTVQKTESLSNSEAFTNKVLKEFGSNVAGNIQVTDYQRQLIQGYFIATDRALKMAEEKRVSKNENNKDHKWDNPDPINWNTVDLNALALDVVHYARMGLDMMQDNHLSAIPFKDNNRLSRTGTKMYVVNLMPGYNGIQYIAEKYALEKPVSVTVELVYSTDTFKPLKKNRENRIESYDFEINNAFDRGQIVGGFGYIEYEEPTKNKLIIMTLKDILKRKPEKASGEFWGGKKTAWEKGQKVEVETEGWFEEMCLKTVKREVYSAKNMPRDPKKIDDAYEYMRMQEIRLAQMETQEVIDAEANQVVIDTEAQETPQKPAQPAFLTDDGGQQALDLGSPAKPQAQPQPARNTTAARSTATRAAGREQKRGQRRPDAYRVSWSVLYRREQSRRGCGQNRTPDALGRPERGGLPALYKNGILFNHAPCRYGAKTMQRPKRHYKGHTIQPKGRAGKPEP